MSTRPTAGEPAPFRLPQRTELTLGNGLRATLVEYGVVPKASLRVALRAGGLNEPEGASGLTVLASRYLKEGAGDLDAGELAARLARCGGGLDTHSGDDATPPDLAVLSESAHAAAPARGGAGAAARGTAARAGRRRDGAQRAGAGALPRRALR